MKQYDQIDTPSGKKALMRIYRDIRFHLTRLLIKQTRAADSTAWVQSQRKKPTGNPSARLKIKRFLSDPGTVKGE